VDFFEHQEAARRRTALLVVYFASGIVGLTAGVYLVFAAIFLRGRFQMGSWRWLWDPDLFGIVSAATLAVILVGSLLKILELRHPGAFVAIRLGGRLLSSNTTDPDARKLLNVVEEMAIASGTPVPEVYLLEEEGSINAFAAGHSTSDAAIGVTSGCMKLLTRDELQGVIAHEFSHILNGDMRLNLRLIGLIQGMICISLIGRGALRAARVAGRSRSKGVAVLPLIGLALLVLGSVGVFFGRMIKSAISRQREFLADAAAVQFTRNPDGLSSALKKIGGLRRTSLIQSPYAEEASHLFFADGMSHGWFSLSTHPPLIERIVRMEPGFDGKFIRIDPVLTEPRVSLSSRPQPEADGARKLQELMLLGAATVNVQAVLPYLGAPGENHLHYASELLASIPTEVKEMAHEPLTAVGLVYACLLGGSDSRDRSQVGLIEALEDAAIYQATLKLLPGVAALPRAAKLPLIDLALPALRQMSPVQFGKFQETFQTLIQNDREIDLFEYTLQRVVLRHLAPYFGGPRKRVIQYYSLRPLAGDCRILLSALAHLGHDDPREKERAFSLGILQVSGLTEETKLLDFDQSNLPQIDEALNRVSQASPRIKKTILQACAYAIAADGVIQAKEGELFRAIADTLDCPIPPFIAQTRDASPQKESLA